MNNKDNWGIVKYIGESNSFFTKDNYYYVVMYLKGDSWRIFGIIDNEEYGANFIFKPNGGEAIDLNKNFEIIIDKSNLLENIFKKDLETMYKV